MTTSSLEQALPLLQHYYEACEQGEEARAQFVAHLDSTNDGSLMY
jgi:hypothetical protein